MSRPTQAAIDASKELWELGVRKDIEEGDRCLNGDDIQIWERVTLLASFMMFRKPIWTDPDECIKWLREKGIITLVIEVRGKQSCISYIYPPKSRASLTITKAPTLIEALLKAMMEISNKKEVIQNDHS